MTASTVVSAAMPLAGTVPPVVELHQVEGQAQIERARAAWKELEAGLAAGPYAPR